MKKKKRSKKESKVTRGLKTLLTTVAGITLILTPLFVVLGVIISIKGSSTIPYILMGLGGAVASFIVSIISVSGFFILKDE